jgi:hypothetical protein
MAALDHDRLAIGATRTECKRYSVRASLLIIAGLSLGFWGLVGFILYEAL